MNHPFSRIARRFPATLLVAVPLLAASFGAEAVVSSPSASKKPAPDFSISPSPSNQTVLRGEATSYSVSVVRTGDFTGDVTLDVSGLPAGVSASWSPSAKVSRTSSGATLTVFTTGTAPTGAATLTIIGSGTVGGKAAQRTTSVKLVVDGGKAFTMAGNLTATLTPGRQVPLDIVYTNPNNFAIKLTRLAVSVDAATSKPGCSGATNFFVAPFSGAYPVTIPKGSSRLSQAVTDSSKWPQVAMRNLASNQDACKNAKLVLRYDGTATK